MSEIESNLRDLSVSIREFNIKKRNFINKEHREMETKLDDGKNQIMSAPKTGANWFKAGDDNI